MLLDSCLSEEDSDRVDAKCKTMAIAIAIALVEGTCLLLHASLLNDGYS